MPSSTTQATPRPSAPFHLAAIVAILGLLAALPVSAALKTVGSNPETCDYTDLGFAVALAGSGDVLIVEGKSWTAPAGVNFNVWHKSLTITGGFDGNCMQQAIAQPTILQGTGTDDMVLDISSSAATRSNVTLNNLVIEGGQNLAGSGGGLRIEGDVSVIATNVTIQNNQALHGAGISLDTTDGASLVLGGGSRLEGNDASGNGGGIQCFGGGSLRLESSQDTIIVYDNSAEVGGGLHAGDCDTDLAVPAARIIFQDNVATEEGGGIYVGSNGVLTGDGGPLSLLQILSNDAEAGGGLAVQGANGDATLTRVDISGNQANLGSGLFVEGASLLVLAPEDGCSSPPCNVLSFNGSTTSPLAGAFLASFGSGLLLESTRIQGNHGTQSLGRLESGAYVTFKGVEVVGNNNFGSQGLWIPAGAILDLRGVTFADQLGMTQLVGGGGYVNADGIIAAGTPSDLFDSSLDWDLDCAVLTAGLPGGPHPWTSDILVTADPGFVDRAGGDLHLGAGSPAIDVCPAYLGHDIDSQPRPMGEAWEAGADEYAGEIFDDGFESGSTSAWS